MNKHHVIRTLVILFVITINIGCDQVSKSIVRQHVGYNQKIELIHDNLILTKVENSGAFLSLGDNLPGPAKTVILLLLPTLVLLMAFGFTIFRAGIERITVLALCCVVGGGIGNIFDRLVYGSVTDFLHIDFGPVRTGIFNMADVSIMTGAAIILVQSILRKNTTP